MAKGVLKKALKGASIFVGGLLFVVLALASLVLFKPALVINDRSLEWGGRFARAHGQDIRWRSAHIQISSRSLLQKQVALQFEGLCANLVGGAINGCFDRIEIAAAGGLSGLKPSIREVGPITIAGGTLAIGPSSAPAKSETSKPAAASNTPLIPDFLAQARVHPISIDLTSWKVAGFAGALSLRATETGGSSNVALNASAQAPAAKPGAPDSTRDRLEANVELGRAGEMHVKDFESLLGWNAQIAARDDLTSTHSHVDVHGTVTPHARTALFDLDAGYGDPTGRKILAQLTGDLQENGLHALLNAQVSGLAAELPTARVEKCEIAIEAGEHRREVESVSGGGGHVLLNCHILADAELPAVPSEIKRQLPAKLGALLRADLDTASFPPSPSEKVAGTLSVELNPHVEMQLFKLSGGFESSVSGIPTQMPQGLRHETNVALHLSVPKFANVIAELSHTAWAAWSPVRALDGSVDLNIKGRVDTEHGRLPFQLTTRLASPQQKLDIDASGQLAVSGLQDGKPRAHASVDVALSDVQLELPRLDLKAPPRLTPDPRIGEWEKKSPAQGPQPPVAPASGAPKTAPQVAQTAGVTPPELFTYEVAIHTIDQAPPVRILTNMARKPIPIRLNLKLASDSPVGGEINVHNFPVEFFNRKANVDHFDLTLASPTNDSRLDGAVSMNYTDYVVTVLVVGTVDKPQIQLVSQPPLTQDEIVSVLLYGRTMDELDPDQTSSVGNTQAAVADRALGLLSLFALASTPVQSVGYDPGTQQVLVKVRLAQGTSLNLGSQPGGLQDIGIRKSLGPHWSVSTDLNPPAAANANRSVVSAFLEWSSRY